MIIPPPLPRYLDIVEEPPPAVAADAPAFPPGALIAQLGAYGTRARAEEVLLVVQLASRPESLPINVRAVGGGAGGARFRVVAGPLTPAAADRLCARLHAAGEPCRVQQLGSPPPDAPSR